MTASIQLRGKETNEEMISILHTKPDDSLDQYAKSYKGNCSYKFIISYEIHHQPFFFNGFNIASIIPIKILCFPQQDQAMFKSVSTRRGSGKYERLGKEASAADAANGPSNEELKRSASVPALASGSSLKMALGSTTGDFNLQRNPTKKANDKNKEKSHPLFSFFDLRRKKKPTARPEFARYIEYVKEGGMWESNSDKPVMHYK